MKSMDLSLANLLRRFWRKSLLTWVLVLLEGIALVLMPLAIGWAVDDFMNGRYDGISLLGGLCLLLLIVGSGRRFYDTRAYAAIYQTVAGELVEQEKSKRTDLSRTSARVKLFAEFIDFLEESLPAILHQLIALGGTLLIILFINIKVLMMCLLCIFLTALVYTFSSRRIYNLNQGGNNEFEKQVDILKNGDRASTGRHFKRLMRWQIRLSDLETINYSLIWLFLSAVILFTIYAVTSSGNSSFGQIVAAVMYVFGFTESLLAFPLYYQQMVRLQEISARLN